MGLALSFSWEFRRNHVVALPHGAGVWLHQGWYPVSKVYAQRKAISAALEEAEADLKARMAWLHTELVYGAGKRKYCDFQSGAHARAQCLSSAEKPYSSQKSAEWYRGWEWADELLKGGAI